MQWKTNKLTDLKKSYSKELAQYYNKNEAETMVNLLIKHYFGFTRSQLALSPDHRLSESEMLKLHFAVKDLKKYKPVQYILGETEFLGHHFRINDQVLIPRPETEEMISYIIKNESKSELKVLDIGTGSGCIAISLKKGLNQAEVHAIDFSNEVLKIAEENARMNQSEVIFHLMDILSPDDRSELKDLDIIVSNPPYVTNAEKNQMKKNVLDYEPHAALFVADDDPLLFYKAILKFAEQHLKTKGRIYFEINEKMGSRVKELLKRNNFHGIDIHKDINGKDRFVRAVID